MRPRSRTVRFACTPPGVGELKNVKLNQCVVTVTVSLKEINQPIVTQVYDNKKLFLLLHDS